MGRNLVTRKHEPEVGFQLTQQTHQMCGRQATSFYSSRSPVCQVVLAHEDICFLSQPAGTRLLTLDGLGGDGLHLDILQDAARAWRMPKKWWGLTCLPVRTEHAQIDWQGLLMGLCQLCTQEARVWTRGRAGLC